MYGFKPQHARGKPVQNFADGGLVNPLAGVGEYWSNSNAEFEAQNPNLLQRGVRAINPVTGFGSAVGAMHDGASVGSARDMAIAAMQAVPVFGAMRAVAPAVKTVAGAAPAVLVPSMAKTAARGAKGAAAGVAADEAQARGFANGGRVRPRGFVAGKGTGTSDSIPARLSNGEYVLPADTVRAVGVETLDALRESTHQPVKGEQANAARGFFAGGTPGGVGTWFQDQEREQEQRKQEANAIASEAAAQSQAESDKIAAQSSRPAAPIGGLANNGGADASRFAQVPAPIGTQPNRTPEPATPTAQPTPATAAQPTTATEQPRWQQNLEELVNPTQYQGQIGNALLKPSGTRDQLANIVPGVQGAGGGRGFVNPSSVTPSATATTTAKDSIAGAGRGSVNPPLANPSAPAPSAQPAAQTGSEIMPGVFKHGRGQYSDDPNGMNMPKGFTGQPSAANNAILERMSDQSKAESMARLGFGPQAQYAAEVQRAKNINADEAARNNSVGARMQRLADPFTAEGRAMRNLQMDIDSSMDRNGRPTAKTAALVAQSKAMSDGYLAEPNQQRTIEAGLQREGMQQAGETARTGMREQGANARDAGRTALARDEFGLRKEAAGFQTRAAKRLEDLQNSYQSAKTPEERAAIAQQLRELQGKNAPAEWGVQVTPSIKNADGSTTEGSVYRYNKATGQTERVDAGAQAPIAAPKAGEVRNGYRFNGGNPNDQANWTKV